MNRQLLVAFMFSLIIANFAFAQDSLIEKKGSKDFYNLSNIKSIHELGAYSVAILGDKIIFNEQHGRINTPLEYNNKYKEFNFNTIYEIKDSLNNKYYFRFGWVSFIDGKSVFTEVNWIGNKPKSFNKFVRFIFSVVDIPFIQFGKKTLCTIGDSQTWFQKSESLRRLINESLDDLIFIGSNTDVYGYGHEGEGGNTTQQLLNRVKNLPHADYYTLLIGTNDFNGDIEGAYLNILEIIGYISSISPDSKIIYFSPLPTTNKVRDEFNKKLFKKLLKEFRGIDNISVLDIGGKIRQNENWATTYMKDGLHPNIEGVRLMAEMVSKELKKEL